MAQGPWAMPSLLRTTPSARSTSWPHMSCVISLRNCAFACSSVRPLSAYAPYQLFTVLASMAKSKSKPFLRTSVNFTAPGLLSNMPASPVSLGL